MNPNLEKIILHLEESEWEINFHKKQFIVTLKGIPIVTPLEEYIQTKQGLIKYLAIAQYNEMEEREGKTLFFNLTLKHPKGYKVKVKTGLNDQEVHQVLDLFDQAEKEMNR